MIQQKIVHDEEKQANISCVKSFIYMQDNSDFSILSHSIVERLPTKICVNCFFNILVI